MAIKIKKRSDDQEPNEGDTQSPQLPPGEDPFVDASVRTASWIQDNQNVVIGAVIAVFVAIIGAYFGFEYVEGQEVEASNVLSPALAAYEIPVEGSPELEQARQNPQFEEPETIFASPEERWQTIYDKADAALAKRDKGELAQSARLTKAAAAYHLGKYDEAIELYEAYLGGSTHADVLPFVHYALATSYGAKGDVEKATSHYDKLPEYNEEYADLALYQKARLYDATGETAKAKDLYNEVLEAHPETPYRDAIERRLALL